MEQQYSSYEDAQTSFHLQATHFHHQKVRDYQQNWVHKLQEPLVYHYSLRNHHEVRQSVQNYLLLHCNNNGQGKIS